MRLPKFKLIFLSFLFLCVSLHSQVDSTQVNKDSVNAVLLEDYSKRLFEIEKQSIADSIKKVQLEKQLLSLKTTDNLQKGKLLQQLKDIEDNEKMRLENKKARIDSLRNTASGFPVIGVMRDTLYLVYSRIGASTAKERASNVTKKIRTLYEDDFLKVDSISVLKSENTYDIVYGETILMSVSENDALWCDNTMLTLANELKDKIKESIVFAKEENSMSKILMRTGLVALVIVLVSLIFWIIRRAYLRLIQLTQLKKEIWFKNLSYKDYNFLTSFQQMKIVLFLLKVFRWFIFAILLYISLPIMFSIFPFSRHWADALFALIWSPFKVVILAVWNYLPNLFSILVIYFVMKYFTKFIKYIFNEIQYEKLKISGFHSDWAMPTYSIIRFLLYAFTFVMIFQYLPGSNSDIFKGVSVFIGILFSLGSSTAIANIIAGLVITYMRPFKIGDRIKIGDAVGDVVEKSLLVTRVKTLKNEIVTIPNSSVLSGNTTNYTIEANEKGLILFTSVTIGYDVPWKNVHKALIDAAMRTDMVLTEPAPFVLQTSLDDFYVSYQLNAYTKEANKQALIYSYLHQNIQDVCNEMGIEIMSPHYRANRDGSLITIPAEYVSTENK